MELTQNNLQAQLKGLIGSKEFICEYLALREKG